MEEKGVVVNVTQEELYRFFVFAEEQMEQYLFAGTLIETEEVHKLLNVLYALKEAALRLQPGEMVLPEKKDTSITYHPPDDGCAVSSRNGEPPF